MSVRVTVRMGRRRRRGGALGGQDGGDRRHTGHRRRRLLGLKAQGFQMRAALGGDFQGETDMTVLDHQPGHHAQCDDIGTALGIHHLGQSGDDLVLADWGHADFS